MATNNVSPNSESKESGKSASIPKVKLWTMFRLGLFQMALGIMSILTLGVLNRVMIEELQVPALIVAGAIAMHQFVAPIRVWFGQMSDTKPLLGYHRSGYVWVGAALFAIVSFFAVQVVWQLGFSLQSGWTSQSSGWAALLALIFALYGVAISASSTPFAALLVDVSDEDNRSKLVGVVWSMLMVGIIIGAIISSGLLRQIALNAPLEVIQTQVNRLFLIVPGIAFALCLLSTVGVEKKYSRYTMRSTAINREDKITLGMAMQVLTASRQTAIFFTFLLLMTLSLFMQDAVLEPYGGEVFKMTIAETTKLNAFFGTGTLIGLSLTGFLIAPLLGKKNTTKLGCVAVAVCLIIIVLAGTTANAKFLQWSLTLFGFASGVTTTGALSLMLDLTAAETAGTFIGAWGLAQAMARALATVSGGAVLNLGKSFLTTPLFAYGLVFTIQAVVILLALGLLAKVNVTEFQRNAKQAIASILESELD
ncbi:BCD family MFS transporter [Fischerella thermalis]|uniref:BCD family MFS transporter n=1 Tax=Fischerella thermalis TaxID=372787 RepID=UPI001A0FD1F8|nr:BCD family MFS transporter [Fischerella thermalis]MBF1989443.1 BCD family MFS transporter [Fischerella thermalis M58_A2018_009]MBF2059754.1 BCD family MFS transporter [Fischerella thermalis M66_A2018_004]